MVAIARGIGLNGHGELISIKKVSTAAYNSPRIAGCEKLSIYQLSESFCIG
jgi:hypothetical protein